MRILHTESSRGWGGQEIRILNEAAGMVARGHEVTIACTPESNIAVAGVDRGLKVVGLSIGKINLEGLRAIRRFLKKNSFDVINTHSSVDSWLIGLACASMRNAPPIVRTRHVSSPVTTKPHGVWLYQKSASHVVTTGEKLRRTLIKDNGMSSSHVTSVPTGIDADLFVPGNRQARREELGLPASPVIVGIVATLRSWKGHQYLLEAFAELMRDDVALLIVGDGPQRQAIEEQVFNLGIRRKVFMPGNQKNVLPWLQAMDLFVLPSYANEGVPQGIMQAMACELPVVSTPVGSIQEVVVHQKTGLMVPPKDVSALTAAIERLVDDAALRARMGKAGREKVMAEYTFDDMLDRMERIFQSVVNDKND